MENVNISKYIQTIEIKDLLYLCHPGSGHTLPTSPCHTVAHGCCAAPVPLTKSGAHMLARPSLAPHSLESYNFEYKWALNLELLDCLFGMC